jgi:hypothetical protein
MIRPGGDNAVDLALASLRRKLDDLMIAFPRVGRLREHPDATEILRLADFVEARAALVDEAVSLLRYEAQREIERQKGTA